MYRVVIEYKTGFLYGEFTDERPLCGIDRREGIVFCGDKVVGQVTKICDGPRYYTSRMFEEDVSHAIEDWTIAEESIPYPIADVTVIWKDDEVHTDTIRTYAELAFDVAERMVRECKTRLMTIPVI